MEKNKLWCTTGVKINFSVLQESILGPLLFLIYINDLPDGITSICKIFANDTSLFSKVIDTSNCQNAFSYDLDSISSWAYQWKLQFNPDPKKQTNKVFSSKPNTYLYPPITFNNNTITNCPHQKHLDVVLHSKLDFTIHIEQKIKRCNKIIGLIRRLSIFLPRKALLTIYKSFIRPNLDYGDTPDNQIFENKLEKVQNKACLAITGATQGISR